MKQFFLSLLIVLVLAGCSSPTPIPTPTPITPKAIALFVDNASATKEQAELALSVLKSIGVDDISRLDYEKDDLPGKW